LTATLLKQSGTECIPNCLDTLTALPREIGEPQTAEHPVGCHGVCPVRLRSVEDSCSLLREFMELGRVLRDVQSENLSVTVSC